jgi:hypothetical protein
MRPARRFRHSPGRARASQRRFRSARLLQRQRGHSARPERCPRPARCRAPFPRRVNSLVRRSQSKRAISTVRARPGLWAGSLHNIHRRPSEGVWRSHATSRSFKIVSLTEQRDCRAPSEALELLVALGFLIRRIYPPGWPGATVSRRNVENISVVSSGGPPKDGVRLKQAV